MGPIAVFDSGVGGLSVLRELVAQMPSEHFLYFGDSANAPYGTRPTAEIRSLTLAHAECLFDRGAKALVVACNTATSAAIGALRARWPDRVIIGIEPALKLAVSRHPGGCIGVLATEATLREEKFAALLQRCAENCHILKCPCPELVEFVERGELTGPALERCLAARLAPVLAAGPDALVLGCTHFPFAAGAIRRVVGPDVELLDGSAGTARETKRRLLDAGLLVQQAWSPPPFWRCRGSCCTRRSSPGGKVSTNSDLFSNFSSGVFLPVVEYWKEKRSFRLISSFRCRNMKKFHRSAQVGSVVQ